MTGIQAFDDTPSMESQFGEPGMTSPVQAEELIARMRDAMQRFVDRVDAGEVRSKRTYAEFKSILRARIAPIADGGAVKPLEWIESGPSKRHADTPFGRYELTNHMAFEWHAHFASKAVGDGPWRSEDKAVAAAQYDYEHRIRSALTHPAPAPGPAGEAMAKLKADDAKVIAQLMEELDTQGSLKNEEKTALLNLCDAFDLGRKVKI